MKRLLLTIILTLVLTGCYNIGDRIEQTYEDYKQYTLIVGSQYRYDLVQEWIEEVKGKHPEQVQDTTVFIRPSDDSITLIVYY